jgi:hypothetical protein
MVGLGRLRDEHRLNMFQKSLMRIFETVREDVMKG